MYNLELKIQGDGTIATGFDTMEDAIKEIKYQVKKCLFEEDDIYIIRNTKTGEEIEYDYAEAKSL